MTNNGIREEISFLTLRRRLSLLVSAPGTRAHELLACIGIRRRDLGRRHRYHTAGSLRRYNNCRRVQSDTSTGASTEDTSTAGIVEELVDKRTETSKTFLMNDGFHQVRIFGGPIHYQNESGEWLDIDDTLVSTIDGASLTNAADSFKAYLPNLAR